MANAGYIGGFTLDQGSMKAATTSGPQGQNGDFILNPDSGIMAFTGKDKLGNPSSSFAGIGPGVIDVSTGARALGRFNNVETQSAGINIGLIVSASGAPANIALDIPAGNIRVGGELGGSANVAPGATLVFRNGLFIKSI